MSFDAKVDLFGLTPAAFAAWDRSPSWPTGVAFASPVVESTPRCKRLKYNKPDKFLPGTLVLLTKFVGQGLFPGAACQVVQRPDGCEGPVDTNAVYVSVENRSKVQCVPLDALQRVENGRGVLTLDKLRFGLCELEYFVGSLVTFATESQWLAEHPQFSYEVIYSVHRVTKDGVFVSRYRECADTAIPFQELVHVGLKAGDDVIIDEAALEFDDEARQLMRRSGHDLVVRVHTVDYGDTRLPYKVSSCGGISWVCSGALRLCSSDGGQHVQPVDASKGKHCFDDSEIEPGDDVIIPNTSLSWNWCRTTNEAAVVRTSGLLLQNAVYRVRSPHSDCEPDELTLRAADSTLVLVKREAVRKVDVLRQICKFLDNGCADDIPSEVEIVDIDRDDHFLSHYVRNVRTGSTQWVLGSGYLVLS